MNDAKVIRLTINGRDRDVGALPNETLLETLRGLASLRGQERLRER